MDLENNTILGNGDNQGRQKDYLLPVSILAAGIMISGSIIYLVGSKGEQPSLPAADGNERVATDLSATPRISQYDVILGDPKAPITLIEYGDYQCPFCGRFFMETESSLREEYIKTGKVKMIFKNFQFLGPESVAAAEAAECAKDQKQFWTYHDALYNAEVKDGVEYNGNLSRDLFLKMAGDLNLNISEFTQCFDSKKYSSRVSQDAADAQSAGIRSTPTVFVNDKKIEGALPYAQFKSVIDSFLTN